MKSKLIKKEISNKEVKVLFIGVPHQSVLTAIREIKHSLKSFTHNSVNSKKDFIAGLNEFHPDIIISDISVPGLNFNQILKILTKKLLNIPVIVFCARGNEDLAVKCVQQGARDYVIKGQQKRLGIAVIRALDEKHIRPKLIKKEVNTKKNNEILKRYKRWESNIPCILYLIRMKPDFSYVFKHISSASKVLLAVEPGKIMKNPVYFSNLIYPADAINLRKAFAEAVNTGTPLNFEARFMVKNEIRWFLFNAHPEIQPDKSITWDGILMDITEKKQAEEAASNERNLMKILMDNLPDVIYFKDLESRFLRVNKAFLKNQDVESETEILNKTDFDMFKPEHAIEARNDELEIIKTGRSILNKVEKDAYKSGKTAWVSTTKMPLKNSVGEIIGTFGVSRNITDLIHVQEALAQERNLTQMLMNNLPDPIYFKDLESRFIKVNNGYLKRYNIQSEQDILQKTDFDIFGFEHANDARNDELQIIKTGEAIINKVEKETTLSGNLSWALSTKIPLRNIDGNIIGTFGVSRDITGLIRAQEELTEERYLMQTLMDNFPDTIYFKDLESRFLKVNKAYLKSLNVESESEILNKTDFDFYNAAHAAVARDDELEIIKSGKAIINKLEKFRNISGKLHLVAATKMPLKNSEGKIVGTFGVSRDITELIHAEQALAAERNLMSTLINSIPDRIYVKDIDGKYIHSNPAHYKSFGLQSQEELIGKTTLDFFPNDEAASNVKDDLKVILTGKEIINSEEKSFWNGDQISWHHVTKVPLRDQQNNITGIICISRDITQNKKIQEQLQSSEARFRHIINAVSAVLYTVKISGSDFERIWVGDNITQFGYNTKEVLEDAWLYNAIHPDDIEYVKSKIKSVLIKEKLVLEYRLKCKDGRYIWITDETVLIRNEDGKPSELFGSWLDITERMKAQENLLTSESQLSVALRIAHLSHWEYDFTKDKLILNDQFYSLLHSSVDREGGYEMSFSQYEERFVFHEDIPALRREVDKAVYAADINYSSQLEHRVNYSDGETGWFSTGMFITKDAQGKTIKAFGVSQDITEHKKAEEALIASETKLNYALKIANLAHWEYDVINEIFTFNNQFYSLFRTTAEKEGGYVMSPMQYSNRFVYPDDKQLVGYEIQRSIESSDPGYSGRVDHRIIYADGEIGYLSVRIFTFRNADGNIYRAFGVSQDITERKQAEEALRKSEVQLSSAVKIANLAYWELDLVKFNFTLNDRYFSLMHTTAENEGGYVMSSDRYLLRFVHPEDEHVLSSEIQKALETKDPYYTNEMELRMNYADGKLGFFLTRFYITKDLQGNTISAFGATQDITQNKLAEKALRASEYFLRKTQSVAHIGSFKYNIKSGTWENSETLDEIFGINNNYTKDIKGWIKLIHPAHRAEVLDVIKNNIVNNKRFDKEYRIIRHCDNQERWVLLLGDLEIDNNGKPVTLIGTIQDITERILREQEKKELDKQLQLRNKELEKMIADLKMMQGTLVQSEKMASLGLLSAGIAHEINNPLAFVSSNANRLKEYFQDAVSLLNKWQDLEPALKDKPDFELIIRQINEYKDQIDINFILQDFDKMMYGVQEGTQRIKKIVEGMRGFAHIADNTFSQARLNQAIDDTLTIVWNEIKYKAEIIKNYGNLPPVTCNIGEIKQVLVNLLVNAAHSIKEKGTISITTSADDDHVYIQIQDTGSGIPQDNLKKIFDPFFTTKPVGKGTGLGLYITASIIEKHSGKITVESRVGAGSTFKIKLPIKFKTADTEAEEVAA